MSVPGGFMGAETYRGSVEPAWIDVNAHVNVAYYVLAFDLGVDALWTRFGITGESIASTGGSTFAVECHVTYQAELVEGDEFAVTSQVLACDEKRIHQFQRLYRLRDSRLAATAEWMNLFVDLETRRVARWPAAVLERMRGFIAEQGKTPMPAEAGKRMSVRSPLAVGVHNYGDRTV